MKKVEYKLDTANGVSVYRYLPKAAKEIERLVSLGEKVRVDIFEDNKLVFQKDIKSQEDKDIKSWLILFEYPKASFQSKFYQLEDALQFIRDTFDKYGAFNYKATLLTYVNGRLYDETNY
ncbi:MAG: hypothetical protein PUG13_01210 [Streptococcus hyointestinalis]|nr:hypothetical protein [Streptococcus hyointestinalis]MDD6384025.1 hypothetical protein [Streptococcus hyointestinalis]